MIYVKYAIFIAIKDQKCKLNSGSGIDQSGKCCM